MEPEQNYLTSGFNKFLRRPEPIQPKGLESDISLQNPTIRQKGVYKNIGSDSSDDGRTTFDWSKGELRFTDGAKVRARFGNLEGIGNYGVRIADRNGNIRMESSDILEQFNAYDNEQNRRVLLGDLGNDEYGLRVLDGTGATRLEISTARNILNIETTRVTVSTDSSTGDFTDIQAAVDYIDNLNGGIIFVKSGTYYPTQPLILHNNITLQGEDRKITFIDLSNVPYSINGGMQVVGTSVTVAGTVAINSEDSTIEGTSTQFQTDGVLPGDDIILNGVPYEITSVTSETGLILKEEFVGSGGTGIPCRIDRLKKNNQIENLCILNGGSDLDGVGVSLAENFVLRDCILEGNNWAFNVSGFNLYAHGNIIRHNARGAQVGNTEAGEISRNYIYNNATQGLYIAKGTTKYSLLVSGNIFANNFDEGGVRIKSSNSVIFSNNYSVSNTGEGISVWGGNGNLITNNICIDNTDGISLKVNVSEDCEDMVVANNICRDNSNYGIRLSADALGNLVHGNFTANNTLGTILDDGIGNSVVDNWS
jgi:parallel beta-helix repeat protein